MKDFGVEPKGQCCENGNFGDGHECRKQPQSQAVITKITNFTTGEIINLINEPQSQSDAEEINVKVCATGIRSIVEEWMKDPDASFDCRNDEDCDHCVLLMYTHAIEAASAKAEAVRKADIECIKAQTHVIELQKQELAAANEIIRIMKDGKEDDWKFLEEKNQKIAELKAKLAFASGDGWNELPKLRLENEELKAKLGRVNGLRDTLQWIDRYINQYCVISHPRSDTKGIEPEEKIRKSIADSLKAFESQDEVKS